MCASSGPQLDLAVFRALLILALAERKSYRQIKAMLKTTAPAISRWKQRFEPKRVYIPKVDGRQRLPGIAALDKIVQQAVVTVLNQIREEDFVGSPMGSGPGEASTMRCGWESCGSVTSALRDTLLPPSPYYILYC